MPELHMVSQTNWNLEVQEFVSAFFFLVLKFVLQFFKAQLNLKYSKIRCNLLLHR